jgi:hypothetical protein
VCAEIDDEVKAFLAQSIEGDRPYLWILRLWLRSLGWPYACPTRRGSGVWCFRTCTHKSWTTMGVAMTALPLEADIWTSVLQVRLGP